MRFIKAMSILLCLLVVGCTPDVVNTPAATAAIPTATPRPTLSFAQRLRADMEASLQNGGSEKVVQLLRDTQFAQGFSPANQFGVAFSVNSSYKYGYCTRYKEVPQPYVLKFIPAGPVSENMELNKTVAWGFNEGIHKNFTDENGNLVEDLYDAYLVLNHEVIKNDDKHLEFVQYNNIGLDKNSPDYNRRLVKRITTNKQGQLSLYYDGTYDFRNVAYRFGEPFVNDTWPHMSVDQNMYSKVDLEDYQNIWVTYDFTMDMCQQVSQWPNDDPTLPEPVATSCAAVNAYFLLRLKSNPSYAIFVGHILYGANNSLYNNYLGLDQYKQVFSRSTTELYGGKAEIGQTTYITFDLLALTKKVLKECVSLDFNFFKDLTVNDFTLAGFGIGYENMGVWKCQFTVSNLNCLGVLK